MVTWKVLSKFKGYRISPPFLIDLKGYGAVSQITWDAEVLDGTLLKLETSISDDGVHWTDWVTATNGGAISGIASNKPINNIYVRYKTTMETNDAGLTPLLKRVDLVFQPVIEINNVGIKKIRPEVWITKIGNGDLSIINTSNGNEELKFKNLLDGETVYINGEREFIETSLAMTYRYDDFNDNYLEFVRGSNVLKVTGEAKIQFRYQWKLPKG